MNNFDTVIKDLYSLIKDDCYAIYLGGSRCSNIIKNPHDYDIIIFIGDSDYIAGRKKIWRIRQALKQLKKKYPEITLASSLTKNKIKQDTLDCICFRWLCRKDTNQIYGKYNDRWMIKLAGKDVNLDYDILGKDKQEYITAIKRVTKNLALGFYNQKRWYQVYIGLSILENNVYELTDKQKLNANILHDMKEETLDTRLKLQQEIISKVNNIKEEAN